MPFVRVRESDSFENALKRFKKQCTKEGTQEIQTGGQVMSLHAIKESAAGGKKDMGKVMRIVMSGVKGAADGKLVNQRVKDLMEKA